MVVRAKGSFSVILILVSLLSGLMSPQFAQADDSPPITGLYISSSYEHLPAYQGNTNVYLEWTLWLERSYWDTHEIHNVECTSTRGNCLSKGLYSPARIPPQGQIRVDSLSDELPVDITLSVVTKLTSNPTETSTYTITHTYRSLSPDFNYFVSPQRVSGGMVQIEITSPLVVDARQYKTWFSCASASGATCYVSGSYNSELTTWIGQVQLSNYTQGQNVEVIINRHWATAVTNFAVDGTYGSTVKKMTISTLGVGLAPIIGSVTSEADGCSFNITNYNPLFEYFFKRDDSSVIISDSGRVRLKGQLPATIFNEYPSSRRTGYTTINNVSQAFDCSSLISESIRNAQLEAAAREARLAEIAEAQIALKEAIVKGGALTTQLLNSAELLGSTDKNIAAINADIALLSAEQKQDFMAIRKVVIKHATVDAVASKRTVAFSQLVETGITTQQEGVARSIIMRALRALPSDQLDTVAKINKAINEALAAHKMRKDRIKAVSDRTAARNLG